MLFFSYDHSLGDSSTYKHSVCALTNERDREKERVRERERVRESVNFEVLNRCAFK